MTEREINNRILFFCVSYNEEYHADLKPEQCTLLYKKDLEVGQEYWGYCRNSDKAIWTGKEFEYKRYKFGSYYTDTINHFEDDDGYDLFVPVAINI